MTQLTLKTFDFSSEDIGAGLLESITSGLYRKAGDVIREYISNEIDNDPAPKKVHVAIDAPSNMLRVWGDGPGMTYEQLRHAVKIGISSKDPKANVGFRGIGIWAGLAACEELVIATKSDDEGYEYEVHVDCRKIRTFYSGDQRNKPLTEVLDLCTGYIKRKSDREHGTEVRLREILPQFQELLVEEKVRDYLMQECPVAFEDGFKFSTEVEAHLKKELKNYRRVKMYLNGVQLKGLQIQSEIRAPILGVIEVETGQGTTKEKLAAFWLCHAKTAKTMIGDHGLRVRVRNFTVMDPAIVRGALAAAGVKSLHELPYWVGEFHAIHPNLRPNAERRDLETSIEKGALLQEIKELWEDRLDPYSRLVSEISTTEAEYTEFEAPDLANQAAGRLEEILQAVQDWQLEGQQKLKRQKPVMARVSRDKELVKEMEVVQKKATAAFADAAKYEKRVAVALQNAAPRSESESKSPPKPGKEPKSEPATKSQKKPSSARQEAATSDATARIGSFSLSTADLARAMVVALVELGMSEGEIRKFVDRVIAISQR